MFSKISAVKARKGIKCYFHWILYSDIWAVSQIKEFPIIEIFMFLFHIFPPCIIMLLFRFFF